MWTEYQRIGIIGKMSDINGSTSHTANITEGTNLGLGMTVDSDGDMVVLLWVDHGGEHYGVALTENAALALSQSLTSMASEITKIGDATRFTPEELDARMSEVIKGISESGPKD
jgi:hypothetical protein